MVASCARMGCKWLPKNMFKLCPGIELEWNLVWTCFDMVRFASQQHWYRPWISYPELTLYWESPTTWTQDGWILGLTCSAHLDMAALTCLDTFPRESSNDLDSGTVPRCTKGLTILVVLSITPSNLGGISFSHFHCYGWGWANEQWSAQHNRCRTRGRSRNKLLHVQLSCTSSIQSHCCRLFSTNLFALDLTWFNSITAQS